jgi:predicted HAD superfamily hydrolase
MIQLYSFDIYDTVLVRMVIAPEHLFILVGQELVQRGHYDFSAIDWMRLRIEAEKSARRTKKEEICFDDIFAVITRAVGDLISSAARDLELRFELNCIVGITENINRITKLVSEGKQVCYVSDMYHSESFILDCLTKVGAPILPLFVSSSVGKTKSSGALFNHVADAFNVRLTEIQHTGDNKKSDCSIPHKLGISTNLYLNVRPTRLESEIFNKVQFENILVASVMAGAMRAGRLSPPFGLESCTAAIWEHGAQTGGLLHIGFVCWIIKQVKMCGFDQVFFLARDGYLPWRLYNMARLWDTSLPEAKYLYVSRQSLHSASLDETFTEEDLLWILAQTEGLTFGDWLFRLGLDYHDSFEPNERQLLNFPVKDFEIHPNRYDICRSCLNQPLFQNKVFATAKVSRELVVRYLDQEEVRTAKNVCLVDIGWNGRMQRSIRRFLRPDQHLTGLYLGLHRTPSLDSENYYAWLFDCRINRNLHIATHTSLYETLFSAPHETTFGYRLENNVVKPVLAPWDPVEDNRNELNNMHDATKKVFNTISLFVNSYVVCQNSIDQVAVLSAYRWLRYPTYTQAKAFSKFAFGSDQINKGKEQLIYSLNDLQILKIFSYSCKKISKNHWREGQVALVKTYWIRQLLLILSFTRTQIGLLIRYVKNLIAGTHDY